ncbi:MAG: class II aldolase/adducin family protein [Chitinophagales bacterium]
MTLEEGKSYYTKTIENLLANNSGYQSWGEVTILDGSLRLNDNEILRVKGIGEKASFETISIKDDKSLHAAIYRKKKPINSILITHQTNASQVKETIPPILDDQAQLLGPTLKYIPLKGEIKSFVKQILRGLKGRYATILSNEQSICIGKSIEDAYIAAQLVEKTSKAFLEAKHLGGAKGINIIEAWLMHKFYLYKYSKESEKNR